jgi:transcriptional regulator with XRE-family HTH domain
MSKDGVGANIRTARKMRGMTLQQLADATHISVASLEKYESGGRNPSTRAVLDIAKALRVGTDQLNGQPYMNGTEADDGVQAVIPDLRRIMLTYDAPEDLPARPRSLPELEAELERVSAMRRDGQYVPMGQMLPQLLTELTHTALDAAPGREQEQAYWLLARAYRAANSLAHKLGYHDLSMTAIERVRWAAARSGDPLMDVIGGYLLLGAMLRQGAWRPATRLMTRLETQVHQIASGQWDDQTRGMLGSVVLKRAAARARQGDIDGSMRAIEEAEEIAAACGGRDLVVHETAFGPSNIRIHEVHSLLEIGDAVTAVARAQAPLGDSGAPFEPPADLPGERRSHHFIDLAAAQLATGDRSGALASLQEAKSIAPNHTRFHPTVRSTAATLVRTSRTDEQAAAFARWAGAI